MAISNLLFTSGDKVEKADALPPRVLGERLESWKEIGNYLNRDVRTVERWESTRGLPVHRLPGGAKARVYALKPELDAWRNSPALPSREAVLSPGALPSIAVLPFANFSADKENEYFGDGLAEDIIDALTKLPGLRVVARTSAFTFRGKDVNASAIGAKLKAGAILEGSVRRSGNRIRVAVQLIKTADQSHLWSERYDRKVTDVFAIQDEISRAVVENLRVRLGADQPMVKRHTENLEAYNLFLRGRHLIHKVTEPSLARGKDYLAQAIALDSNYALAYTGLAEYYLASAFWGLLAGSEAVTRAKSAALAAVGLDDTLAEAHAQLGAAMAVGDFDWAGAEREFQRALELNPASPIIHFYYGSYCLRPMGRVDEELPVALRVIELDPLSARYNACLGYVYMLTGQYNLALEQIRFAMDLDKSMYQPHFLLAATYMRMGRFEETIAAGQKAYELSGHNARTVGLLALAYGLAGRRSKAQAMLEKLVKQQHISYVPASAMATAYRGMGDMDQALQWLEKGVEERDLMVVCLLKVDPTATMRGHPRHQALLRKMNLEP